MSINEWYGISRQNVHASRESVRGSYGTA
jgi:hypothetical protein